MDATLNSGAAIAGPALQKDRRLFRTGIPHRTQRKSTPDRLEALRNAFYLHVNGPGLLKERAVARPALDRHGMDGWDRRKSARCTALRMARPTTNPANYHGSKKATGFIRWPFASNPYAQRGSPGAGEGIRTLDPDLGKVVLYQ